MVSDSNGDHSAPPTRMLCSFEPCRYAILVNTIWLLSTCSSLSCGLAVAFRLVQQWVRKHLKLTRHADTLIHHIRILAFLSSYVQVSQVRMFVESVPPTARGILPLCSWPHRISSCHQRQGCAGCPHSHLFLYRHLYHRYRPPRNNSTVSLPDPVYFGSLAPHASCHRRLSLTVPLL